MEKLVRSEIVKETFSKIVSLDLHNYEYEINFDDSDNNDIKEIAELLLKMNILQIKELISELDKRSIYLNIYNLVCDSKLSIIINNYK